MQKTIISILIGVVIVGAGIFLATKSTNKTQNLESNPVAITPESSNQGNNTETGKKMAFSELMKQGGSYQCVVTQYIDSAYTATTEGKVFINNTNIRADFAINTQGMQFTTSMITRDGSVYTWTSLANIGYKTKQSQEKQQGQNIGTSGQFAWNSEMVDGYQCDPWAPDMSKFTLPTNITFQEI